MSNFFCIVFHNKTVKLIQTLSANTKPDLKQRELQELVAVYNLFLYKNQ